MGWEKCLRCDVTMIVNHFDSRENFLMLQHTSYKLYRGMALLLRRLVTLLSDNGFFFYETSGEQIEAVRRNGRCYAHAMFSTIWMRIGQRSNQENFPFFLSDAGAILQILRRETSPISSRDLAFLRFSFFVIVLY